jgi:HEAT repeat protein
MPRETIRKLSETTERLLVAGAHLAADNADLGKDKAALQKVVEKLGAKAPPAFNKLIDQIDDTVTAKPKDRAAALVTLAASLAQVRAGLAQLAPAPQGADGETALAPAPEVQTPCNSKDLYALHDALVTTGSGRMEIINQAIERNDAADLRLVHAAIQAMSDGYIGEVVCDKIVPSFGRAIVEPVRRKLRFPGKAVDGRRLRALVAVEKQEAKPLIDQAIAEGSAELRAAALDAIADHLPGLPEVEPIALAILEKERSGEVRRAAVRALGGYASDASLEKLLAASRDPRTLYAATEALGKSKHPRVVDRLLELLAESVGVLQAKVKKGDKSGESARTDAQRLGSQLLGALARHADPRVSPAAKELLSVHGATAAHTMMAQGTDADLRFVADLLGGNDDGLFRVAVEATLKLPDDEIFDRLSKPLLAKDKASKLGLARVHALHYAQVRPRSDAWVKLLLDLLAKEGPSATVVDLLGRTGDPRATEPLLQALEKAPRSDKGGLVTNLVGALRLLGDRRAIDPILERLHSGDWSIGWSVRNAVVDLADESTVAKVRAIYAALKEPDASKNWNVRYLLGSLERKFPGS